jgi:hypothetical protein
MSDQDSEALPKLTIPSLKNSAALFLARVSGQPFASLYGVTDGKAVGTVIELGFQNFLKERFEYTQGNAANGIDLPEIGVDLKTTSIKQPQSSCPFRSADQKVYGLGYHLLVFVYSKTDVKELEVAQLAFCNAVFVDKSRTADFQTTKGLRRILDDDGNIDDVMGFLEDRNLPLDEVGRLSLAERIINEPPAQGVLTISNALQWRLQYTRAIACAGQKTGVEELLATPL